MFGSLNHESRYFLLYCPYVPLQNVGLEAHPAKMFGSLNHESRYFLLYCPYVPLQNVGSKATPSEDVRLPEPRSPATSTSNARRDHGGGHPQPGTESSTSTSTRPRRRAAPTCGTAPWGWGCRGWRMSSSSWGWPSTLQRYELNLRNPFL